ncbi:Protein OS-9, partial [Gryganskiella cystojenkinii]
MRSKVMSPTRAAILTCATISLILPSLASAFSAGFVYNDLLAHPQYQVKELGPIPLSDIGAERVQRGNDHHQTLKTTPLLDTIKEQDDSKDDPTKTDSTEPPSTTMIMKHANGQQFACTIPPEKIVKVQEPPPKSDQELAEEERRNIRRGLELLDHLSGYCLQRVLDFWTYEYCHKKRIRQYHAVSVNNKIEPASEELT